MCNLRKSGEQSSPGGKVKSGKITKGIPPPINLRPRVRVDFKVTKAGKSGIKLKSEDDDTIVVKEEKAC